MKKIDLSNVPNKPGCYLWKDINGEVIYVGKAKKLRNRMRQYFNSIQNPKTSLLVKNIADFEYVLVSSELDSLLVELNLINKYSPKYNIKLKQTKTYPYLILRKEPMLRIEIVYKLTRDKNLKYFGPFPEGFGPRKVKKIIESIYPISKCLKPYSGTPCLNYQLGLCPGYCFKDRLEINEEKIYNDVKRFLRGDNKDIIEIINKRIAEYSTMQLYEQAQKLFEMTDIIEKYSEKQKSYFKDNKNRDIVGYKFKEGILAIAISFIRYGKLVNTQKFLLKIHDIDYLEFLNQFLYSYYQKNLLPNELIIDFPIGLEKYYDFKITNPKQGIKKTLLDLAFEQAENKLFEEKKTIELKSKRQEEAISDLKKIINFSKLKEIELVDISHSQGKNVVGAIVHFTNFIENKSLYRKFLLDQGNDDYQNIYNTTYRHFRRKLMNGEQLPDLYIIDGKNQLKSAQKALEELNINDKVKIISLIKNAKHDTEAIFTENLEVIPLVDKSSLYLLLGAMQDEVHRFVIKFQREKVHQEIFK